MQKFVLAPSISIAAYSIATSTTTLTLTAANTFSAGEIVTFTDTTKTDPLYPLNGVQLTVLPSGLSATQFEVQTSAGAVAGTYTPPASVVTEPTNATVQGSSYVTIACAGVRDWLEFGDSEAGCNGRVGQCLCCGSRQG
jgi:hypothetical protein